MAYTISKVDVWAADIANRAGTLAGVYRIHVGFRCHARIHDRTESERPHVTCVHRADQRCQALSEPPGRPGCNRAKGMHSLRIEGPDRRGLGAKITRAVAEKGINLRGASAAAIGKRAVFHIAVESEKDLKSATARRAQGASKVD